MGTRRRARELALQLLYQYKLTDASPEEMQALVTHVGLKRAHRGTGYRLAIVAQDAVLVMLADIFKALSSPLSFQVRVFRDIDEARSWISSTN